LICIPPSFHRPRRPLAEFGASGAIDNDDVAVTDLLLHGITELAAQLAAIQTRRFGS
jgi:hypothetical protein